MARRVKNAPVGSPKEFCVDLTPGLQGIATSLPSGVNWAVRPRPDGGGISVDRTPLIPEVRLPSSSGPVVWAYELREP